MTTPHEFEVGDKVCMAAFDFQHATGVVLGPDHDDPKQDATARNLGYTVRVVWADGRVDYYKPEYIRRAT